MNLKNMNENISIGNKKRLFLGMEQALVRSKRLWIDVLSRSKCGR